MNSRTRQDELIRILRRRGSTTVDDLTETLGVSRRTVLRDIAELRDQGFIIRTTAGPGGGVCMDPKSILVSPRLSGSEVFALLISVAVLKETHTIPFANLADAGLNKIEQSLPRDRVLELREILKSVYVGPPASSSILATVHDIDASVLPAFETGFLQTQRMQFRYMDRHGRKSRRSADPHGLLVLSPVWYLIGYDPQRQGFRHFRMDRIGRATVQGDTFRRRSFTVPQGECPFFRFG